MKESFFGRFRLNQENAMPLYIILASCFAGLLLCHFMSGIAPALAIQFFQAVILSIICLIIVVRPLWGIVVIAAALPIGMLLPPVPFASSVFPLFGAAAVVGYMYNNIIKNHERPTYTLTHGCSLLLIGWIVASNPVAAISTGDRVWVWTFLQLFVLMFLTTQLLKRESDHHSLMWAFVLVSLVSALVSIQQVKFGLSSESSLRGRGLAYGANDAGRYFVIAIVFVAYLRHRYAQRLLRILSLMSIAILLAGLAATVSRTSLLLLLLAFGLMSIEHSSFFRDRLFEFTAALVAAAVLLIPAEYWHIVSGIVSSIVSGKDSIGFRYMQWDAGLAMWADHPILGVGIGQFEANTTFYGTNFIPFYGLRWAAHNTYVTVLAETGIIGLLFFLAAIFAGGAGLLATAFRDRSQQSFSPYYAWFTTLVILLIGGITGDDHAHKLVWLILGIGGLEKSNANSG